MLLCVEMSYGKARASPLEEAVAGSNSCSSDPKSSGPDRCVKLGKQRIGTNSFINSLGRFSLSLSSGCKTQHKSLTNKNIIEEDD